jgi:hypothetical protein
MKFVVQRIIATVPPGKFGDPEPWADIWSFDNEDRAKKFMEDNRHVYGEGGIRLIRRHS